MAEKPTRQCAIPVAAIIAAGIATALWLYILDNGGWNRLRVVDTAVAVSGGNPAAGYDVITSAGCGACHQIPGIPAAHGKIGPSLAGFKDRAMIGGVMANSADNLTRWLQNPRTVDPQTAMPDLGLSLQQARDAASYLYADGLRVN